MPERGGALTTAGCVQRLEQLRGDGDCDGGGRFAFNAGDANRANELLDERRRDAIFAKARAKTGGFAFRTDQAEPCKGVTLKNGVAQGVIERVIVSEDDVHRILWCFGEKLDRLRLLKRANIRRQGGGQHARARIHPGDIERQIAQRPDDRLAHMPRAENPECLSREH